MIPYPPQFSPNLTDIIFLQTLMWVIEYKYTCIPPVFCQAAEKLVPGSNQAFTACSDPQCGGMCMKKSDINLLMIPNALHGPKNNLNLFIKTEPVTVGAEDATVYVWFVCFSSISERLRVYLMWKFRLFLAQRKGQYTWSAINIYLIVRSKYVWAF